jgi:hypothetical protein
MMFRKMVALQSTVVLRMIDPVWYDIFVKAVIVYEII